MRHYATHPAFNISMTESEEFQQAVRYLFESNEISHIVETGTNIGTGSTKLLAETALNSGAMPHFTTIEANWLSWRRARRNLRPYRFVRPLWGLSIGKKEALDFIRSDEALLHPERYPDVYIDTIEDPQGFYLAELDGHLGGSPWTVKRCLPYLWDSIFSYSGEGLLARCLETCRTEIPLVLLDSAGGIGWLEFQTVMQSINNHPFLLILDDIHHIKHFRSFARLRDDRRFNIQAHNLSQGWMIAKYEPEESGSAS